MDFLQPTTWSEALAMRAEHPGALAIQGGTDVMVDLNFDRRRPGALLDLGRVPELREWAGDDGRIRLGADEWTARSQHSAETFAVGEVVRILEVEGATAVVGESLE